MRIGIKIRLEAVMNHLRATLKVGSYWYWLDPAEVDESIPIKPLVYPMRFDILVRKSFFDFYAEHRDLYADDPAAFIEEAKGHSYYVWFNQVLMVRFYPECIGNLDRTHALYSERVAASIDLYESLMAGGFDATQPIIPYTGHTITPPRAEISGDQKYFMGDGCHRLACLMSLGYDEIPRKYVKVKCFSHLRPFDNTTMLQDHLAIEWPAELSAWEDSGPTVGNHRLDPT